MRSNKTKFLKNLLTTVSLASVITAAGNSFSAPRTVIGNNASLNLGVGLNKIGGVDTKFVNDGVINWGGKFSLNADLKGAQIKALNIYGYEGELNIVESTNIGSIVNTAMMLGKNNKLEVGILAGKDLTLTGTGTPGLLGIANNDYRGLGEINFSNNSSLTVEAANMGAIIFANHVKAINPENGTLNVKSNLEIQHNSFAAMKTINIDDNKVIKFSTDLANGNRLNLQQAAISSINFGATGAGTLEITANPGKAALNPKVQIMNGSLGGVVDNTGIISIIGEQGLVIDHATNGHAIIGVDAEHRAKKLILRADPRDQITLAEKIFAKDIELNEGEYTFSKEVNVGKDGATGFVRRSDMVMSASSNLGKVNFNNTNSSITIGRGANLTGNFYGDQVDNTKVNGTIIFEGNNELHGNTANLKLLKVIRQGDVKLSGNHKVETLEIEWDDAKFQLGNGDYKIDKVVGSAAQKGILEFTNVNDIELALKKQAVAARAIEELRISGGNVRIVETANGANAQHAIEFKAINFTNANSASTVILENHTLEGLNINSSAGNAHQHTVAIGKAGVNLYNILDGRNNIGSDENNLVNIRLNGLLDQLDVQTPNFFSSITTNIPGKNQVAFNVVGGGGKVYGLGEENKKLELVVFATDTENFGDTNAVSLEIRDGVKGTLRGNVNTEIQLGHVNANGSEVIFKDSTVLNGEINTVDRGHGDVTFQGDALVGNIGSVGAEVGDVKFTKAHGNALVKGKIYATNIDFGSSDIKLPESMQPIANNEVIFSGISSVNGNMNLSNNQLVFQDGNSNWGANTSINTTFIDGKIGHIIANDKITADNQVANNVVTIVDNEIFNQNNGKYLVVNTNNGNITLANGAPLSFTNVRSTQAYSQWSLETDPVNKNIYATRTNVVLLVAPQDIARVQGDEIVQQNAQNLINQQDAPEIQAAITDIGNLTNLEDASAIRGEAWERMTETVDASVNSEQLNVSTNIMNNVLMRTNNISNNQISFYRNPTSKIAAASGDENEVKYGAWATPFYNQSNQKQKNSIAGYAAKTTGGIVGFDAEINEDLVVGAAVTFAKTDMKHKNKKRGDKTKISTVIGSLYGSKQVNDSFFVQGVVSYGSSKVNNKEQRFTSNSNRQLDIKYANGKYNSKLFNAELLFGNLTKLNETLSLTPAIGIRYGQAKDRGYTETGNSGQNKSFLKKSGNKIEAIIGARISDTFTADNLTITPEAHLFVSQKIAEKTAKAKARLQGQINDSTIREIKAPNTLYNLGLSINAKQTSVLEYGIGYDATIASKYIAHQGTLNVRVNF